MTSNREHKALARRAVSMIAVCAAVATACASLPSSQLLADDLIMNVGEETVVDVLVNDYSQSDIDLVRIVGSGDGIAQAKPSGDTVIVSAQQEGVASFRYVASIDGVEQTSVPLIVNVEAGSTTPAPRPEQPTPTPTSTPRAERPTPTPTPDLGDVDFDCGISVNSPIVVEQRIEMFATYDPRADDIYVTFHHGDGTTESGSDRQDAFYRKPGVYTVRAEWSTSNQTGEKTCGSVVVIEKPLQTNFACGVTPTAAIGVQEAFEMFATSSRSDLVVTFDHGDGTLRTDGYRQTAWYLDTGAYTVSASWRTPAGNSGSATCGTVTVTTGCSATTVRRPNGFCEPLIKFDCKLFYEPPLTIFEGWSAIVTFSPADAPIIVTIDHGDGYVDAGTETHGMYDEPGSYDVYAHWKATSSQGRTYCGQLVVEAPVS